MVSIDLPTMRIIYISIYLFITINPDLWTRRGGKKTSSARCIIKKLFIVRKPTRADYERVRYGYILLIIIQQYNIICTIAAAGVWFFRSRADVCEYTYRYINICVPMYIYIFIYIGTFPETTNCEQHGQRRYMQPQTRRHFPEATIFFFYRTLTVQGLRFMHTLVSFSVCVRGIRIQWAHFEFFHEGVIK